MQVKQEQIGPCEVELEIEVEARQVSSAVDDTYRELGKAANIRGFRKGKAPREVLERHLDGDKVKDRVADKLFQSAYTEALEQAKVDPFAPADVEIVKFEFGEPLVFKAKVPLAPNVELGQYVGLEVERKVPPIEDEHVEEEIRRILERHATLTPVTDREAQKGDTVVVQISDDAKPEEEPKRNMTVVGENLPDFDKGVLGMKLDEEKVIEITYPDDYAAEELRGKTVPLRTKLVEINVKNVPELTDEWVKDNFSPRQEEGKEAEQPNADAVDTVDKLRGAVRTAMEKSAQDIADADVENSIMAKVTESSKVEFPDVMTREEVDKRLYGTLEELKQREVTLQDYLKQTDQTLEQLRERYGEEAKQLLTTSLVLNEIIEKESIKVEEEDVRVRIREMAADRGVPVETVDAYLERTGGMSSVRNRVLHKKVMDFLVHASNIKSVGRKDAD